MSGSAHEEEMRMKDLNQRLDYEAEGLSVSLTTNANIRALLDGTIKRPAYIEAILCQFYHYTRDTSTWLRRSGERLGEESRRPKHAAYLIRQSIEEEGHDRWAQSDCMALGVGADIVHSVPPSSAVRAYNVHNDAMSKDGSPYAILGPKYVLEYLSVKSALKVSEGLRKRRLIPGIEHATTFLDGHAGADISHLDEVRAILDEVTDPWDQEAIVTSARLTTSLYPLFFSSNFPASARRRRR
jgi:hypothetical protein